MNELGPYIGHAGFYNWNEIYAARKRIREQAEVLKQEETNIQAEMHQASSGTDREADVSDSRKRLYAIKKTTSKGLGFVATSKISKGTRILLEAPLFKTQDSSNNISSAEIMVLQEVKSLTKDQQRAFFSLQNAQGRKYSPILGIVTTNMLPLGGSNSDGLFLEASRINHSCQPNAQHAWNNNLNDLTVHALCDIEVDREITISYIGGVSLGCIERQCHLMDAFSFACMCELCSLPLLARFSSDLRLDQIRSVSEDEGAVTDLDQVLEHSAMSFGQVCRLFELLNEESICDIRISRACFNAFQIAAVVGDKARAKVFAERAYAAGTLSSLLSNICHLF